MVGLICCSYASDITKMCCLVKTALLIRAVYCLKAFYTQSAPLKRFVFVDCAGLISFLLCHWRLSNRQQKSPRSDFSALYCCHLLHKLARLKKKMRWLIRVFHLKISAMKFLNEPYKSKTIIFQIKRAQASLCHCQQLTPD